MLSQRNGARWERGVLAVVLTASLVAAATLPGAPAAAEVASVSFAPATVEVGVGATSAVAVRVDGVSGLYGVDLTVRFDPTIVEVADADAGQEGVQLQLGDFLDPGLVVTHEADNTAGTARLVLTQLSPSEARSGGGTLCVVLLRGKAAGSTGALQVEAALASREGEPIAATTAGGEVRVVATEAAPATPTPAPTVLPVVALPTQEGADAPTPTVPPTSIGVAPEPTATAEAVSTPAAQSPATATPDATPQPSLTPTSAATTAETPPTAAMPSPAVSDTPSASAQDTPASDAAAEGGTVEATWATDRAAADTAVSGAASATTTAEPVAETATPTAVAIQPTATPQVLALADEAPPEANPATDTDAPAAVMPVQAGLSPWLVIGPVAVLIAGTGAVVLIAQSSRRRRA